MFASISGKASDSDQYDPSHNQARPDPDLPPMLTTSQEESDQNRNLSQRGNASCVRALEGKENQQIGGDCTDGDLCARLDGLAKPVHVQPQTGGQHHPLETQNCSEIRDRRDGLHRASVNKRIRCNRASRQHGKPNGCLLVSAIPGQRNKDQTSRKCKRAENGEQRRGFQGMMLT
jgi:hypothetical protein